MSNQPLHKACDDIYKVVQDLLTVSNDLDNGKVLTANKKIQKANSVLSRTLTPIRNSAIKYEGKNENE